MSELNVKICGLSTFEAIDRSIARGARQIGLVCFEKSPRHVDLDEMVRLADYARGRAETVIVTVDPDDALVDRFMHEVKPDWLQLHGRETPERCAEIAAKTGFRIMKALPVADIDDLDRIEAYRDAVDRLLLDSKRPKGSNLPGGNGVAFDWRLLAALDRDIPFMLSGGLDAENVGNAVLTARPAGLDVSSGVESAPGVKDIGRIDRFFDALDHVREADLQGEFQA